MSDLNVYSCTARLGTDAEIKDINGKTKARYRVAVSGRKDQTTWLTCEQWEPHPVVLPLLVKGARVALSGRLEEQQWTGKDGAAKSAMVFVVGNVTLLTPKAAAEERPQTVIQGAPRRPKWETDDADTPF